MKYLFTLIVFFASTTISKQGDYISIEYVGISDKPIMTVIVSKKKFECENCMNYLVNEKVYYKLKNFVEFYSANRQRINFEKGGFKLTIHEKGSIRLLYFLTKEKSDQLFDKIIEILDRKNENEYRLLLQLQNLKRRIGIRTFGN